MINRSDTERYSVAFFAIPDLDAEVACLPSCMALGNPPKYPPRRVSEFMPQSNATDWKKDPGDG